MGADNLNCSGCSPAHVEVFNAEAAANRAGRVAGVFNRRGAPERAGCVTCPVLETQTLLDLVITEAIGNKRVGMKYWNKRIGSFAKHHNKLWLSSSSSSPMFCSCNGCLRFDAIDFDRVCTVKRSG